MSCSFWLRRHNAAAKKRKEERLKAEAEKQTVEAVEPVAEKPKTVRKTTKKAVESNDNA